MIKTCGFCLMSASHDATYFDPQTREITMRRFAFLTILLSSFIFTAACGPREDNNTDDPPTQKEDPTAKQGYTSCSDDPDDVVVCPPGNYCRDSSVQDCDNGCQSNENCVEGQTCVIEDNRSTGLCKDKAQPQDQLARCKEACTVVIACGVTDAGDPCDAECSNLTESQQKSFADCTLNWGSANSCPSTLPGCLGLECGPSYACGGGLQCVNGSCL